MDILSVENFSTALVADATDTKPPKSQLVINGNAIKSYVDGATLECCIKYNSYYLVFMTDDVPYEETLRISLLDSKFSTIDYASLGWAYSTGSFKLEGIKEPNTILFHFFGGTIWNICLYPTKRIFLSIVSEPRGVSRKLSLFHYFKVSGNPVPDSA